MIEKILIANRGEIACRIIRTARRLGINTVAVYSDADARALHVRQADEAINIGGNASADSYLNIDNILSAIRETGADAVHPGFGFLSENAEFAKTLADAGVTFIGPGTRAIEVMGDKIESKKLADAAGVSTVPGHPNAIADADEAYRVSQNIGCPVMLKASAGGGGKGMRVAHTLDEVRDGFIAAQNEARGAFGDDRVFVEKFIQQPRHIEIQLIADSHGNSVYLAERECSIQRRHQKVIEEAPSSFISEKTRQAMGEQAVALAQAVDYQSAGTVEFIVDSDENFYFLEMNTRLQVEHPVTECITGVDLVELMIAVANKEPLPLKQQDVKIDGWAFEARVYAEDPDRGFLPSTGRISHYTPPEDTAVAENSAYTRVDTGIDAGGEISMYYDPMIAKLITWAPTRDSAIEHMRSALDSYRIDGVRSNLAFLSALFAHPALHSGDLTTAFIEEHFAEGFDSSSYASSALHVLPLVAAWLEWQTRQRDSQPALASRVRTSSVMTAVAESLNSESDKLDSHVLCVLDEEQCIEVAIEKFNDVVSDWRPGDWLFRGHIDDLNVTVGIKRTESGWQLSQGGAIRHYSVVDPHVAALMQYMPARTSNDMSAFLLSPMPGLLMKVLVDEGEEVTTGQDLAIIEAMKMENTLKATINGTVSRIVASVGDSLAVDAVILEFEA